MVENTQPLDAYLGISSIVSQNKQKIFASIKDGVQKKVQGWQRSFKKKKNFSRWQRDLNKEEGLRFRDLELFNQVLIAKQAWRVLRDPNSLASQILKGKYFPKVDFLQVTDKNKSTFPWKSLIWGKVIQHGVRWKMRHGRKIKVSNNPWLPWHMLFRSLVI